MRITEWADKFVHLAGAALLLWLHEGARAIGPGRVGAYLLGVFCLLLGGYALNDVADFAQDAQVPPGGRRRPLTRRAHSLAVAGGGLVLGLFLLLAAAQQPWPRVVALLTVLLGIEYSLPPLRLKERGGWGVLAGAVAQKPALFLVLVLMLDAWNGLGAVLLAWLLFGSLVGLLGHQVLDARNDTAVGVHTFAARRGAHRALGLCVACAGGVGLTVLAPFALSPAAEAWRVALPLAALSVVYPLKSVQALRRLRAPGNAPPAG
jgi:4-hydroxybenzoate polyprenyltransferase